MVILGLGSNIGDRLNHLRQALAGLNKTPHFSIQEVSPVYQSDALLPQNASNDWDVPYLNCAMRCETTLKPQALLHLLKNIEKKLGRLPGLDWGPRIIDIDILAWNSEIIYDDALHIPHEHLHERPFALFPLADIAPFWIYPLPGQHQGKTAMELAQQWGDRSSPAIPLHTQQIQQRIDTPELMGIINLTPDSFSRDGLLAAEESVLTQALNMIRAGATILDIGAEATGPNAAPITPDEEWQRLSSILTAILAEKSHFPFPPKISVDTRHASVAQKSLALGVDWINDVSGLDDPAMREVVRDHHCDVVFMHHLGIPVSQSKLIPLNENVITHVYEWAERRIESLINSGIDSSRLIFDIGIGFGKTKEQSLALIKQISHFKSLGVRLLVGHSRKSFLSQFTPASASERDIETTAISLCLANQPIDYLRVHNVDSHARALKVRQAVTG